jgi:hypothetical protein
MKRNLMEVIGSSINASDGDVGKIKDFYFDDHEWKIRYLVIELKGLGKKQRVLLSPVAFRKVDWEKQEFIVDLTKDQIKNNPYIDADRKISKQNEAKMHAYYKWPVYWGQVSNEKVVGNTESLSPMLVKLDTFSGVENISSPMLLKIDEEGNRVSSYKPKGEPKLRSINEMIGYKAKADDYDDIGYVDGFYFDDETWTISYMQVKSRKLLAGEKTLISPHWVSEIGWDDAMVFVDLTMKSISECPEFDPTKTLSINYEAKICKYYFDAQ